MKSAVTVKDGRAYYELQAGRIDCYVGYLHNGTPVDVQVALRPYTQERMIRCLREDEGFRAPARDEAGSFDVIPTDPELTRTFVDEHLIEMRHGDRVLTPRQIEVHDAMHGLKPMAFTNGYDNLMIVIRAKGEASVDDIFAEDVQTISIYGLWCDEKGVQQQVNIDHHFSGPTAKDNLAFSRTHKVRTTKDGNIKIPVNHEARVKLYDSLIQSVDGVLTNGQLCGPANKSEWLPVIPLKFKMAALNQLFRGASTKNG